MSTAVHISGISTKLRYQKELCHNFHKRLYFVFIRHCTVEMWLLTHFVRLYAIIQAYRRLTPTDIPRILTRSTICILYKLLLLGQRIEEKTRWTVDVAQMEMQYTSIYQIWDGKSEKKTLRSGNRWRNANYN
jgi:hypothetical protein